jgi:biotin transport system ATP-binding protein
MAMDADLVIFDEPYANLDWPGVLQVNAVLSDLRASGKTVIVLTHELEKILARADRLLVLHAGRIVWQGKPVQAVTEAPLESWGIRNPLGAYRSVEDLVWENPE